MNCFFILISDVFHFLTCRDLSCYFEIIISVINEKIRIATDFVIDRWDCLLNVFNQLLNFVLLSIICSQLVFVYSENCWVELLICSYKMSEFDKFWLLNSWLRVFCNCSLRISSLWLRSHLKCCCRTRIEVDIWFNRFLNLNFTVLNYFSKICSHYYWLKFFFSWFLVCWDV